MRKYSTVRASANEFGGMMHTSPPNPRSSSASKRLRVDDGGVDVGEDLELARAAHVVAVARSAVGNDLARRPSVRTCSGANGSIMLCSCAMRRIQLSRLDAHLGLFHDDLGKQAAAVARAARQRSGRAARSLEVCSGARRSRRGDHRGPPAVGLFADVRIERQLAEQRHTVLRRPCARRRRRRRRAPRGRSSSTRARSCSRRCRAPARRPSRTS